MRYSKEIGLIELYKRNIYKQNIGALFIVFYVCIVNPFFSAVLPRNFLYGGIPALFVLLGLIGFLVRRFRLKKIDIWLLSMFSLVFTQGLAANFVFGQPLGKSIIASSAFAIIVSSYYISLQKGLLFLIFETCLKFSKFIIPISFILLYAFQIDNKTLSHLMFNTVLEDTSSISPKGLILSYGSSCCGLAFPYLLSKYRKTKKVQDFFWILFFLVYFLLCIKGRTLFAGQILITLLCFIQMKILYDIRYIFVGVFVFAIGLYFNQNMIESFLSMFTSFGLRKAAAYEVSDSSTIVRTLDIAYVTPYIKEYYLFGVGNLSNTWRNGFFRLFGDHFYVSDIGIYGALFTGGIYKIGIYIGLYTQSILKLMRSHNVLSIACFYMLIIGVYNSIIVHDFAFFKPFVLAVVLAPVINTRCLEVND